MHKHCSLYRSLEHRTRDCGGQGAEEGAILAKTNVLTNTEVRFVARVV